MKKYAPKANIFICCVSEHLKFEKLAVEEALEYLNGQFNPQDLVIVLSFGHRPSNTSSHRQDLIKELVGKGAICVAAAGNDGLHVDYIPTPANLDNVIAVGGLDEFNRPCRFNNPGQEHINVYYAPGVDVPHPSANHNVKYDLSRGSSIAAPAIAGIVGLMKQLGRDSDIKVNMDLVKKLFSKMTINLHDESVLDPKKFFLVYGTKDKFKKLVNELQSSTQ